MKKKLQQTKNSESYTNYLPILSQGFDLLLIETGYEYCNPAHCWNTEGRRGHLIHYVLKGEGKAFADDREYEIKENDIFYSLCSKDITYLADENNPWEYIWVNFDGVLSDFYMKKTTFNPGNPVQQAVCSKEIETTIRNIISSAKEKQAASLFSTGYIFILLGLLVKYYGNTKSDNLYDKVDDLIFYINKNFRDDIPMSKLSKHLGMDRTTIYRLFKQHFNISPSAYIEKMRISYACDLLQAGETNLNKVAIYSGFNDYSWFCKVFKRNMTISPKEYLTQISYLQNN